MPESKYSSSDKSVKCDGQVIAVCTTAAIAHKVAFLLTHMTSEIEEMASVNRRLLKDLKRAQGRRVWDDKVGEKA